MRSSALLAIPCLLTACHEIVVLGSECPDDRTLCRAEMGGRPDAPGSDATVLDGGNELTDASDLDAPDLGEPGGDAASDGSAGAADGAADAGPIALFPAFQNPSFELSSGSTGEVSDQRLAPWYACRNGIQVQSSVNSGARAVLPTDGKTFLGDSFPNLSINLVGLNQDLSPGLRAGTRYAFVVDVYGENSNDSLVLQLASGSRTCIPPVLPIASSAPIRDGSWQRMCFAFTAPRDVSTIVLMAATPADFVNFTSRLYVDNIRSEPDCQ